jgi:Aromatic-ring-opening dioxygenase LigAB, LigA subunit
MNTYRIHSFCRRVLHDPDFRQRVLETPELALKECTLDDTERHALLSGDVVSLYQSGASAFLLLILTRFRLFGLELPIYNARMRSLRGNQTEVGAEQRICRKGLDTTRKGSQKA